MVLSPSCHSSVTVCCKLEYSGLKFTVLSQNSVTAERHRGSTIYVFIILRIKAFLYKKAPIHSQNYVQKPVLSKSCLIIQRIEDNRTCLSGFLQINDSLICGAPEIQCDLLLCFNERPVHKYINKIQILICHSVNIVQKSLFSLKIFWGVKILSKFILEFFLGADINIQRYIRQTHIGSIFMDYYIIAKRKGNPIFLSESFMTTYLSHMYFDSHSAIFYIFL